MNLRELFGVLGLDVDESGFKVADALFSALKTGATAFGVTFGAATLAVLGAAKATSAAADRIDELAIRAAVATNELQELAYAGSFSSVGIEDIARAMSFLARKGVKDVKGELFKLSDQVKELLDAGDKAGASKLASKILGPRQGPAMIAMLKDGSAALQKLGEEARAAGVVLDETTIKQGAEMDDALERTNHALRGLTYTIGAPLMKPLTEVIEGFSAWIRANRQLIASGIQGLIRGVGLALKLVWFFIGPIVKGMLWLTTTANGLKVALITLIALTAAWAITAAAANGTTLLGLLAVASGYVYLGVAAAIAGARAAIAWLITLGPLLAVAAGIAVVLLWLEDLYQFFTGGKSIIGDAVAAWKQPILEFATWAWGILKEIGSALANPVAFAINAGVKAVSWASDTFGGDANVAARLPPAATSPAASAMMSSAAAPSPVNASFRVDKFEVTAAPGQDPKEVASAVRDTLDDWHATKMREAVAGVSR